MRVDDPYHWLKDQSYPKIDDEDVLAYPKGKLLVSAHVPAGDKTRLVETFRYTTIKPIELEPGRRYVIAALYTPKTKEQEGSFGISFSTPGAVRWLKSRRSKTPELAMPDASPENDTLYESRLHSLPLLARGKVRDNYAVGSDRILMVASDRLSAFDVIMGQPIPGKGEILTKMALFWFARLGHLCPNHLTGDAPDLRFLRRRGVPNLLATWLTLLGGLLIIGGWSGYDAAYQLTKAEYPPGPPFNPVAVTGVSASTTVPLPRWTMPCVCRSVWRER